MFEVIVAREEIEKYQHTFHALLHKQLPRRIRITIGYKGESLKYDANTDGQFWHISETSKDHPGNIWNAFGFHPDPNGSNNIWVQVSLYQDGINRRVGGCLGIDRQTDEVCLLHRGKIGGGRPGIGKKAFMDWLKNIEPERFRIVQDGDRETQMIWVAHLDEATMLPDLQAFVKLAWEFKKLTQESQINPEVKGCVISY